MLTFLFSKIGKYVAGLAAGLALLASVFYSGKRRQKADTEVKQAKTEAAQAKAEAKKQVEVIEAAKDVQNDVNKLDPGVAAERLRDKWSRD